MIGRLTFEDGSFFEGTSFGFEKAAAGEAVFTTGMVGYPESLTDPSYLGQILIFSYPLIGNYGVAPKDTWESQKIQTSGLIVSSYNDTPSHQQSQESLSTWLKKEKIPALQIDDTRALVEKIRDKGSLLGKIEFKDEHIDFYDPNLENVTDIVSTKTVVTEGTGNKTVALIDCGAKENIKRSLLKRGLKVITVPWDYDFLEAGIKPDAVLISNGPGDPTQAKETIAIVKKALKANLPIFGICLGHQILALAAGGQTKKMKFGHRSQNQPCLLSGMKKCLITTQNHGYAVSQIPPHFKEWFYNGNDNTNEGIIHDSRPVMSVQFHPEATPGPEDADWIFDYFLKKAL